MFKLSYNDFLFERMQNFYDISNILGVNVSQNFDNFDFCQCLSVKIKWTTFACLAQFVKIDASVWKCKPI